MNSGWTWQKLHWLKKRLNPLLHLDDLGNSRDVSFFYHVFLMFSLLINHLTEATLFIVYSTHTTVINNKTLSSEVFVQLISEKVLLIANGSCS